MCIRDRWIGDAISHAEHSKLATIEATQQAEEGWTKTCLDIANMTLFPKVESWIFGANIPGKKSTVMFYMAGLGAYRQQLSAVESEGYQGFLLQ